MPSGPAKNQAITQLAQTWSSKDPTAAFEWLKQVPNPAIQRDAMQNALWNTAQESPETAADFIKSMPKGLNQVDLTRELAQRWAETALKLPPDLRDRHWDDALTYGSVRQARETMRVGDALDGLPVAVLLSKNAA